jgi:HSP20 family protein
MFGTTQRDPMLDLLYQLERRTGRIFNEPFRTFDWSAPEATTAAWLPLVDIFEEPDAIRLVAEVPGVRPSDVKITVEDNLLTIKGTKEQVPEETAEKVHRYERTYGAFERSFRLSASIDANKIKATYNLGVLTITLPKAETAKPHLIKVEITPELTPEKALLNA